MNDQYRKNCLIIKNKSSTQDEIFRAYYRLGFLSELLKHTWEESELYYFKAFQVGQRVEPLCKIAEHYRSGGNIYDFNKPEWISAYFYSSLACDLVAPMGVEYDKKYYDYKRWSLLAESAFHVSRYDEGKEACLKAIKSENKQCDRDLLNLYNVKEVMLLSGKCNIEATTLIAPSFKGIVYRPVEEL